MSVHEFQYVVFSTANGECVKIIVKNGLDIVNFRCVDLCVCKKRTTNERSK